MTEAENTRLQHYNRLVSQAPFLKQDLAIYSMLLESQFIEKYERQKLSKPLAFQFARRIYAQDGTVLAGPELYNKSDGIDYVRIKGRNWAMENGYELICNFDYVFEMNDVGSEMVFFYDVALPDWCKSIVLKQMRCVFTDKKTYKMVFPESTPFN